MTAPLAIVTCGPAHEPIDSVRRITNASTGELGTLLCQSLAARGFRVLCYRGEGATHPAPAGCEVIPFATNGDLLSALERAPSPAAFLHAAALCDFALSEIEGADAAGKISSATNELILRLRPAIKILPLLPTLFPDATIVGWKYEVDGGRADALARARRQFDAPGIHASVANGPAYGEGFGFLSRGEEPFHIADKKALSVFLAEWLWERRDDRE